MIYLDHSATTPIDPRVLDAMLPWLSANYGNPSSTHVLGRRARVALEDARTEIAHAVGAHPSELLFTSGGTESNNTILHSCLYESNLVERVYCSAIEHHSVLDVVKSIDGKGATAGVIPVDTFGRVAAASLQDYNETRTLVSVMHVNNEIGTVQDITEIRSAVPNVLFHSDMVQSLGKVPVHLTNMGLDFAAFSAHKINGPKGVGALFVRKGLDFKPVLLGGGQERNRRAGTENLASIIGFQTAVRIAIAEFEERTAAMTVRTEQLRTAIHSMLPNVRINTPSEHAAPNILNISFPNVTSLDGESILQHLDIHGVCVSNGSACVSGSQQPSHVLQAIGLSENEASAGVRFSVSHLTTAEEIFSAVTILEQVNRAMCV